MSNVAVQQSHIIYRRQDLPKGHGAARPSETDSKFALNTAMDKFFSERKEVLLALSKV